MSKLSTVNDVKVIESQIINSRGSNIYVLENINSFFFVKRIFIINNKNHLDPRGAHAHKNNAQTISCPNGKITLQMTDGKEKLSINLFENNFFVYVPSGIWSDIIFIDKNSTVICHCSENYNEKSYIRNYKDFIEYKNN